MMPSRRRERKPGARFAAGARLPEAVLPHAGASRFGRFLSAPRPSWGHTLPEMLVVLTILTLFAVLVLPSLASALMRNRMDAAVEALRGDLNFVRTRAIASGLRHVVTLDPATGEWEAQPYRPEVELAGGTAAGQLPQAPVLQNRFPEGIRVRSLQVLPLEAGSPTLAGGGVSAALRAVEGPMTFYPEGYSDSAVIVLEDTDGERLGLLIDGYSVELRRLEPDELP